jgi:hypothetical protein
MFKIALRHLYLSISSIGFYRDVYRLYKGYGIKFLFTISSISSLIYCIFLFNNFLILKESVITNRSSDGISNLEYILNQLPDIHYENHAIAIKPAGLLYIYDLNNRKIAAIDPSNQLSYPEKTQIPIVFTNNQIIFSLANDGEIKHRNVSISYSKLFGNNRAILNQNILSKDIIKEYIINIFTYMKPVLLCLVIPILIIVRFLSVIFIKGPFVILLYFLTNLFGPKTTMQSCIRLVFFASGAAIFIQSIIMIIMPSLQFIGDLVQFCSNILLCGAIIQIRKSNRNIL